MFWSLVCWIDLTYDFNFFLSFREILLLGFLFIIEGKVRFIIPKIKRIFSNLIFNVPLPRKELILSFVLLNLVLISSLIFRKFIELRQVELELTALFINLIFSWNFFFHERNIHVSKNSWHILEHFYLKKGSSSLNKIIHLILSSRSWDRAEYSKENNKVCKVHVCFH